jgi:hypothetical protein
VQGPAQPGCPPSSRLCRFSPLCCAVTFPCAFEPFYDSNVRAVSPQVEARWTDGLMGPSKRHENVARAEFRRQDVQHRVVLCRVSLKWQNGRLVRALLFRESRRCRVSAPPCPCAIPRVSK